MSWVGFWGIFLVASLALYALVVVAVGIGAFFDVRRLFASSQGAANARERNSSRPR
ncbi:MAG TPA: hypothetical protein VMV46_09445 [Thermoanaerobaculia bacterium]|nr:hypothetical protein [Thermoanaerobaculia bacterium]